MSSSRDPSPVPSTSQSLLSRSRPTRVDDGLDFTPTTSEATPDETNTSRCEFDIDWENIWHNGKRLVSVKRRSRHKRVIGTKIKESWIYQHGANLEHDGVRYWLCKICHMKRRYSTALYASSGTTHAARHLLREHQITEFGEGSRNRQTPFVTASQPRFSARLPLRRSNLESSFC
jgi:hypothetical protein